MKRTQAKLAFVILAMMLAVPGFMVWKAFFAGPFEYSGWSGPALNTRMKATTPNGSEVPDSVLQSRWLGALITATRKVESQRTVTRHDIREMVGIAPTVSRESNGREFFDCLSQSVDCNEVIASVPRYSPGDIVYSGDRSKLSMDELNRLIGSRSYRNSELDRAATLVLGVEAESTGEFESALSNATRFDIYFADKVLAHTDTIHRCYVFAYSDTDKLVTHFRVDLIDEFVCDWLIPVR